MKISCVPRGSVASKHPRQGISDIVGAGFAYIMLDLSLVYPPERLEKTGNVCYRENQGREKSGCQETISEAIRPMLEQCEIQHLQCNLARAPYLPKDTKRRDLGSTLKQLALESIAICGQAKCKTLIVQPMLTEKTDKSIWESNKAYYLELAELAKQENVQILLENQCADMNGHLVRGLCSDGAQAAEWIDKLNEIVGEERFGFCLDVGACNLCGQNMYELAMALGDRVKVALLCDSYGGSDGALLPFTGVGQGQSQTDWLSLIRGLRETRFDGDLVIDLRDTATAFSPILRPALLKMAKAVAEYFEWQIGIENQLRKNSSRVLFGAGNMCRNYMKCYGEKYPPLFICDNNRSIWETRFCGVSVKQPETLKNLPKDCAVIICNSYYREIETQLRQMGLDNPIEFFNDEYMPTFYFDRLEVRN